MGKRYSPEDMERGLQALAEYGGSATAASAATGIPMTTLYYWKKTHSDEFEDLRIEKRGKLVEEVWAAAAEAVTILRSKLAAMKGREVAVALGILVDKALLMGGEPTEIMKQLPQIVFRGVDVDEYEEREQE